MAFSDRVFPGKVSVAEATAEARMSASRAKRIAELRRLQPNQAKRVANRVIGFSVCLFVYYIISFYFFSRKSLARFCAVRRMAVFS